MRPTLRFPELTSRLVRSSVRRTDNRLLGNKLQEIGARSPEDLRAFHVLADMVLNRLDHMQRKEIS